MRKSSKKVLGVEKEIVGTREGQSLINKKYGACRHVNRRELEA